jgi:hypothetical protein
MLGVVKDFDQPANLAGRGEPVRGRRHVFLRDAEPLGCCRLGRIPIAERPAAEVHHRFDVALADDVFKLRRRKLGGSVDAAGDDDVPVPVHGHPTDLDDTGKECAEQAPDHDGPRERPACFRRCGVWGISGHVRSRAVLGKRAI